MKKKNNSVFINIILILTLLTTVHCERFVEVPDPTDQISQSFVFKDKATALAALADLYANLRSNSLLDGTPSGVNFLTGCYTDDLVTVSNRSTDFRSFYDLSLLSSNQTVDQLWTSTYRNIYAANNILEGVAKSGNTLDEPTKNLLIGESLAIRALLHLYLTQLFGEIPYVKTTDYELNNGISKSSLPKIYDNLEQDLLQSESLLTGAYPSPDKTRLNKTAVQLLLARVYLYAGKNTLARDYANLVSGNAVYSLESSLNNVFLKEATSTLWQFAPVEEGASTLEGQTFIVLGTPPPNAFLSPDLINSFERGDLRLSNWVNSISDGSKTYFFPFKYKQYLNTPNSLEYSIVLRLEEAFLIAAEAENNLGNSAAALRNIRAIRTSAGLTTPTSAPSPQIALMILAERRHEFFTEGGHRFFDLKRAGLIDQIMKVVKPAWQNYMKLWPLPERELLVNKNLNPQNNGY